MLRRPVFSRDAPGHFNRGCDRDSREQRATQNRPFENHERLNDGEGLWIVPCEAVHTFFMKFAIDLIYLDRRHHVKSVVREVRPWRFSACLFGAFDSGTPHRHD